MNHPTPFIARRGLETQNVAASSLSLGSLSCIWDAFLDPFRSFQAHVKWKKIGRDQITTGSLTSFQ